MELIVNIFVPSFFTTYDVYFHKNVLMNLHFCMAKKYHAMALWKTGLINSIVADIRSKTKSVKVLLKRRCAREHWP